MPILTAVPTCAGGTARAGPNTPARRSPPPPSDTRPRSASGAAASRRPRRRPVARPGRGSPTPSSAAVGRARGAAVACRTPPTMAAPVGLRRRRVPRHGLERGVPAAAAGRRARTARCSIVLGVGSRSCWCRRRRPPLGRRRRGGPDPTHHDDDRRRRRPPRRPPTTTRPPRPRPTRRPRPSAAARSASPACPRRGRTGCRADTPTSTSSQNTAGQFVVVQENAPSGGQWIGNLLIGDLGPSITYTGAADLPPPPRRSPTSWSPATTSPGAVATPILRAPRSTIDGHPAHFIHTELSFQPGRPRDDQREGGRRASSTPASPGRRCSGRRSPTTGPTSTTAWTRSTARSASTTDRRHQRGRDGDAPASSRRTPALAHPARARRRLAGGIGVDAPSSAALARHASDLGVGVERGHRRRRARRSAAS